MYTDIPSVMILISLMKQFNIRHVVASPGTRNTALVHSIENDDFFKVYSVVDERSAGFVALGMAEELDAPVCVTCTAATATCNYAPAIKEAYERGIQLVALTADQNAYSMFHMEDQCIDQRNMYDGYIKYAVDVPRVESEDDYWFCNRCINEAFLALNHNGKGPVQINYHMDYGLDRLAEAPNSQLPVTRKINRYVENTCNWNEMAECLNEKQKILVIGGSNYNVDDSLSKQLRMFFEKYNAVIVCDHFANEREDYVLNPVGIGDVWWSQIEQYQPDYIITFGNIFYSTIKYGIGNGEHTKHWHIAIDGTVNDGFRKLENVFEMSPENFFTNINKFGKENNKTYYNIWKQGLDNIKYPDLKFTNFNAMKHLTEVIPDNSIVHMSVLDSIRLTNYCKLNNSIKCFANIGADGIDGALSAFMGQARETDALSFLIIGDLSMMYDMNALLNEITPNIRIFVINNYAGAEFHKNFGLDKIETLNDFIAAGHNTRMKQISIMNQFEYLCADNEKELNDSLAKFVVNDGKAKILEVITDADIDAKTLKEYWKINTIEQPTTIKSVIKKNVKKILGRRMINAIKAFRG